MLILTLHSLVEFPANSQEIATSPGVRPALQASSSGAATGPSTAAIPVTGPAAAAGPATATAATGTFLTGTISDQPPSFAMFQQIPTATIVTRVEDWNRLVLRDLMPHSDGLGDLEVQRVTHKKFKFRSYQHEFIEMELQHKRLPDMLVLHCPSANLTHFTLH